MIVHGIDLQEKLGNDPELISCIAQIIAEAAEMGNQKKKQDGARYAIARVSLNEQLDILGRLMGEP